MAALVRSDDKRAYEVYFPLAAIIILQLSSLEAFLGIEKYILMKQGYSGIPLSGSRAVSISIRRPPPK